MTASGSGSAARASASCAQGNFYATAAVAFGRVYIGSTDGRMYSFSAKDGRIAWAHQTGNYVYSSAAVKNVDGRGPMVFFGSYDGTFYAVDARSGKVRWTHQLGRQDLRLADDRRRHGVLRRPRAGAHARPRRRAPASVAFRYDIGAYDPVISDGRAPVPDRQPVADRAGAAGAFLARRKAKRAKKKAKREKKAALVAPAWPERCRQLAPCGPLVAVRERRARAG